MNRLDLMSKVQRTWQTSYLSHDIALEARNLSRVFESDTWKVVAQKGVNRAGRDKAEIFSWGKRLVVQEKPRVEPIDPQTTLRLLATTFCGRSLPHIVPRGRL